MTGHTEEPWNARLASTEVYDANCNLIFDVCGARTSDEDDCANARRIVDCVNALAGKNPAALDALIEAAEAAAQTLWDQGCNTTASELFDALANFRGDTQ